MWTRSRIVAEPAGGRLLSSVRPKSRRLRLPMLLAAVVVAPSSMLSADQKQVDYNRDIRPILSDTCYKCHGPDDRQRQAGLRLDIEHAAKAKLESGGRAVVPGKPGESLLIQRVTAEDEFTQMPPPDSGKKLSERQIELLKTWIAQGAEWRAHWSFVPPTRPELPKLKHEEPGLNPIDYFIRARLEEEGLQPSPEADKQTLIRRVTFDLTGLPPTLEEIDNFLADDSPGAYEKVVDRLLNSPHYGEHMARYWLDYARYGDTHGLHLDNKRSIWPYRDWVIRAFNDNLPFDKFTVWQLAGDLLPEATLEQKIATGFNRCNVTTSEGGAIAEEFRVRYAIDRVETTGTVFMGLTVGCAVCHEHKFDPISQTEFYQLFAYYNNAADPPMDGNAFLTPPVVKVPTEEQERQLASLRSELSEIEGRIRRQVAKIDYTDPGPESAPNEPQPKEVVWIDDDLPAGAQPQGDEGPDSWQWVTVEEHPVYSGRRATRRSASARSQHYFTAAAPPLTIAEGDRLFAYVYLDPQNPPQEIMLQFNDGQWEHRAYWGANLIPWGQENTPSRRRMGELPKTGEWVRLDVPAADVGLKPGSELNGWAFTQYGGTVYWDKAGVVTTAGGNRRFHSLAAWAASEKDKKESSLPGAIAKIVKLQESQRSEQQQKRLRDYFIEHVYAETRDVFDPLHKQRDSLNKQIDEVQKSIPATLVYEDRKEKRPAYVLKRGEYDKPDKERPVEPGVPEVLPPLPEDAPSNRLGLARWLVSPEHPLTARVTVNRYWQRYFGTGIVKTAEDFGSQGEWPSHPELLDWLAVEFVESGWDVKHMQKLIVMSKTYRQSSKVRSAGQASPLNGMKDPNNRLLARGPRFRLDAEMVRDQALAVAGLLVKKVGGPSVKPYQPQGLWKAVGYTNSNTANFVQDHGKKLYRRSLYTFWKRTSPPPSMAAFDAPSREACTVRRERTNTPLQALTLMNDVQFVEAARHLAERMMTEGGQTPEERITFAFRLATARRPDADELATIKDLFQSYLQTYNRDKQAASKLATVGESSRNESLEVSELAAYTMVANLILNLDETVTKG